MLLLDTCALVWLAMGSPRLSVEARRRLEAASTPPRVSAITAFELGLLHRRGRLVLPSDPEQWYARALSHHGLEELPVTGRIAARSALLPAIHDDPADRMIVATAIQHGLTVLTPDAKLSAYEGCATVW